MDYFGYVMLPYAESDGLLVGEFYAYDPDLKVLTHFNTVCGRQSFPGAVRGALNKGALLQVIGDEEFMQSQTDYVKSGALYVCTIKAHVPAQFQTLTARLGRSVFNWGNEQSLRIGLKEGRATTLDYLAEQGLMIPRIPEGATYVAPSPALPAPPPEKRSNKLPVRCMAPEYRPIGMVGDGDDPY